MKSLGLLWLLKIKSQIRNIFKKPSSAILTIFIIVVYGIMFIQLLTPQQQMVGINLDMHISITLLVVCLALLMLSTMLSKNNVLFFGEDAYYLFAGPFNRKQINIYLILQTIVSSFLLALVAVIFFLAFSKGMSLIFILLVLLASALVIMTMSILSDYIYVLRISESKYSYVRWIFPIIFVGMIIGILILTYLQHGHVQTLLVDFVVSPLFYWVPIFGWFKMMLIGYVANNVLMCVGGLILLVVIFVVICLLFVRYKGDYLEQALNDSINFSKRYKLAKSGNQEAFLKVKRQNIQMNFYKGAYAILSKNLLMTKKTGNLIRISDIVALGIYIGITIFTNLGMGFFIYMMVLWVFSNLQNGELKKEMNNYQIYLIPDHPLKKLIAVMIPTFMKVTITTVIGFIIIGIYYHSNVFMIKNTIKI